MPRHHLVQAEVDTITLADPIFRRKDGKEVKKGFLWDDDAPGLALVIHPTKKSWLWQYDRWVDGKRVQLNKVKPDFCKLKDARDWAKDQTALARRGALDEKPEPPKVAPAGPEAWTVKEALNKYLEYMRDHPRRTYAETTINDFEKYTIRYLLPIHDVKLGELKRSTCKKVHETISKTGMGHKKKDGTPRGAKAQANKALDNLSACWLYAKDHDDANRMPIRSENPAHGKYRNPVGKRQDSILATELPAWAAVVATLTPVKRNMHMIGLFTGLRWTSLRVIERAWVQGNKLMLPVGDMKARRSDFALPLSKQLVKLFADATKAAEFIDGKSKYLFPSPTAEEGFMATDDERKLKKANKRWDGKLRRKTFRSQAELVECPRNHIRWLMDHAAQGLDENYLHDAAMFEDLLKWQQKISDRLEMLCNAKNA